MTELSRGGDTSYALRVGSLNILAHYLTVTSEKIKGRNTQWNSPVNLMEYAPARLRVCDGDEF